MPRPRVVFFGMPGLLSAKVLKGLLRAPCEVVGVVCAEKAAQRVPPALYPLRALVRMVNDPYHIAGAHCIPCLRVRYANNAETIGWLKGRSPDLACIAAFPELLGCELLAVPSIGTLNVHPSLLPRYRGPAPLFWMARAGEVQGGVTVHWVDAGEDTGDILLQEAFPIPKDMTSEELLVKAATVGSRLMRRAVEAVAHHGRAAPSHPQSDGHRNPRPRHEDAAVDPSWGAQRIYRFVRLARKWAEPHLVHEDRCFPCDEAKWLPQPTSQRPAITVARRALTVTCPDGTVVLWRRGRVAKAWCVTKALLTALRS